MLSDDVFECKKKNEIGQQYSRGRVQAFVDYAGVTVFLCKQKSVSNLSLLKILENVFTVFFIRHLSTTHQHWFHILHHDTPIIMSIQPPKGGVSQPQTRSCWPHLEIIKYAQWNYFQIGSCLPQIQGWSNPVCPSECIFVWYVSQKEDTTLIGIHDQPVILAFLHSLPIHFQHLCQSRVSNPNSSLLSCRVQIRNPWLAKMHFQGIKIFRFILSSAD